MTRCLSSIKHLLQQIHTYDMCSSTGDDIIVSLRMSHWYVDENWMEFRYCCDIKMFPMSLINDNGRIFGSNFCSYNYILSNDNKGVTPINRRIFLGGNLHTLWLLLKFPVESVFSSLCNSSSTYSVLSILISPSSLWWSICSYVTD